MSYGEWQTTGKTEITELVMQEKKIQDLRFLIVGFIKHT